MNQHQTHRQPDDPGLSLCPCCGQLWPDDEVSVERMLRKNAGKVSPNRIAIALSWSLERLQRFARNARPPIDLNARAE